MRRNVWTRSAARAALVGGIALLAWHQSAAEPKAPPPAKALAVRVEPVEIELPLGRVAHGMMVLPGKQTWPRRGMEQYRHAAIMEADSRLKKCRPHACRHCKYGFICGGIWKEYYRHFGDGELTSHPGPLILDPWHFMDETHRATPPWLPGSESDSGRGCS